MHKLHCTPPLSRVYKDKENIERATYLYAHVKCLWKQWELPQVQANASTILGILQTWLEAHGLSMRIVDVDGDMWWWLRELKARSLVEFSLLWSIIRQISVRMLMNTSKLLPRSMGILTVYLSIDWAWAIHCGTHDSYNTPPALPMFGPPPKRQKKESFTYATATVLAKAINPSTSGAQKASSSLAIQSSVAIFPGKSVDLRTVFVLI